MSLKKQSFFKVGIGQDSHRFLPEDSSKPCVIGGVIFEDIPGLSADSDGDVVLHSICNAISSITGVAVLGDIAKELCSKDGITDSKVYVEKALLTMKELEIFHVAITIEGKRPIFQNRIYDMRKKISKILKIEIEAIGITATSGDGLTNFGLGEGVQAISVITVGF